MEHVKDVEPFHGIDGIQALHELGESAIYTGTDGLDGDILLRGHVGHPHVAAEVLHQHPSVAVVAQNLLNELIHAFPGSAETGEIASPKGVDNLQIAFQSSQRFVELLFLRFYLLPEGNDFRGQVGADTIGVLGSLSRLTSLQHLLFQALPGLGGNEPAEVGTEVRSVLLAKDLAQFLITHSSFQAMNSESATKVIECYLSEAEFIQYF